MNDTLAVVALEHPGRDAPQMAPFSERSHRVNLTALASTLALLSSNLLAVGVLATKYTSYTSGQYGISFQYPIDWTLKEGEVELAFGDLGQADSALPHGVTVATVVPPHLGDAVDSFFQVRVDRRPSQHECYQSSFSGEEYYNPQTPSIRTRRYPTVRFGAVQFTEAQESNASAGHGNVSRYFHTFANGMCYEFQLGLNWEQESPDETEDAFAPMKDVLASVTIRQPTDSFVAPRSAGATLVRKR
jgi:hypothetical protein